ncbi:MAG: CDP-glucose 4,6-dehydratase [bacterium]
MKNTFSDFYRNKKVLVTGHTGFKGSWLSLWLEMMGAEVIGYSLEPNTTPSMFNKLQLNKKLTHIIGDVRNAEHLKKVIKQYNPEIVFHLAAQPLVRLSYKDPLTTYETNIMGTLNVLEAVRANDCVRAVVNVTSDKCYENKEYIYGYREIDPMGGYDPYSSSKGIAELLTSSYRNSFFNPKDFEQTHNMALASGRAGNVIGGGDWAEDRLIPDCIRSLSNNETIQIRSPKATRPWQHVLEPLSGYLLLAEKLIENPIKYSSGWNFGPYDDSVLTVEKVVEKTIKHWGGGNLNITGAQELHEANLLKLDISKAMTYLDWKPVYKADEAIKETVDWYKEFYSGNNDLENYTYNQIKNYVSTAQSQNISWSGENLK